MNRTLVVAALAAGGLLVNMGCASKKYVRNEVTPVINQVNELDDRTAQNTRDLRDVDTRAQQGIHIASSAADRADQKALAAGQSADQASKNASQVGNRVTTLAGVVADLDNYKPVSNATVNFGFDKAELTAKEKAQLDGFAQQIASQKQHYIVEVQGHTDSVGDPVYNYQLSQRRADAVIQYLAQKYEVPAYRIYLIGLGKDNPVAENSTASGRAQNRRVDVRLMTNSLDRAATQASVVKPQQP